MYSYIAAIYQESLVWLPTVYIISEASCQLEVYEPICPFHASLKARTDRRNWTDLTRTLYGLVFDELTNGRAGQTHWSLVDANVRVSHVYHRRRWTVPTVMNKCLPISLLLFFIIMSYIKSSIWKTSAAGVYRTLSDVSRCYFWCMTLSLQTLAYTDSHRCLFPTCIIWPSLLHDILQSRNHSRVVEMRRELPFSWNFSLSENFLLKIRTLGMTTPLLCKT